jgi:hypothetical protein
MIIGMRLAAALLLLPSLWADAVLTGVVKDSAGGETLAKARIVLVCPTGTTETTTGPDGRFRFDTAGAAGCQLRASLVGYRPLRVELAGNSELELILTPDTLTRRDSVEVSAGPFEPVVESSPSERTLSGAEIKNLGAVLMDDPLRAVQALPGVVSSNDYVAQFSVRAAPYSNIGLYLDGVLLHSPFHTVQGQEQTGSLSTLNSDLVEELTLHAGAPPAAYFDRTAAALDLRLRDGNRLAPVVRVNSGVAASGVVAEGPLGRAGRGSWLLAARKSYLQYILRRASASNQMAFGFTDMQARLAWDLTPRQQLTLSLMDGSSDLDRSRVKTDLGVNSIMTGTYHSTLAVLGWRAAPAPAMLITERVAWMRERAENENPYQLQLAGMGYGEWVSNTTVSSSRWAKAPLEAGVNLRRLHDDGFTARYNFTPLALRRIDPWNGTALRSGGWAQQGWTAGRLTLRAGGRLDRDSASDQLAASPHGSATLLVGPATRVQLAWSQAVQFPALMLSRQRNMGNPALIAERSTHAVAAVEQELNARTRLRVEAFWRADRDHIAQPLLDPRLLGNNILFTPPASPLYLNSVRGSTRGFEVFVQRRAANRLSGWVSYAWTRSWLRDGVTLAHYTADDEQRHTLNSYASYRLSARVNLSARYSYGSNFPIPGFFRAAGGLYYLSTQRNAVRMPAYQRADLRLARSFAHEPAHGRTWRGVLYVEVSNLTNHDNRTFDSFNGYNSKTFQAYPSFVKLFPIVPAAGLMLEWEARRR